MGNKINLEMEEKLHDLLKDARAEFKANPTNEGGVIIKHLESALLWTIALNTGVLTNKS